MRSLIIAAVIATLPTLAQADTRHPKSLLALTPERVRTATTVIDDPLEFDATFSTEKAHREGWLLLKPDGHDNHLRAIVDKRDQRVYLPKPIPAEALRRSGELLIWHWDPALLESFRGRMIHATPTSGRAIVLSLP